MKKMIQACMLVQATFVADAERIILSAPFNFENALNRPFQPYSIYIGAFPPSGERFTSFLINFLFISQKFSTFLYKTVEEYRFLTIFALCFERDTTNIVGKDLAFRYQSWFRKCRSWRNVF